MPIENVISMLIYFRQTRAVSRVSVHDIAILIITISFWQPQQKLVGRKPYKKSNYVMFTYQYEESIYKMSKV
jgi:hypothetical protein